MQRLFHLDAARDVQENASLRQALPPGQRTCLRPGGRLCPRIFASEFGMLPLGGRQVGEDHTLLRKALDPAVISRPAGQQDDLPAVLLVQRWGWSSSVGRLRQVHCRHPCQAGGKLPACKPRRSVRRQASSVSAGIGRLLKSFPGALAIGSYEIRVAVIRSEPGSSLG